MKIERDFSDFYTSNEITKLISVESGVLFLEDDGAMHVPMVNAGDVGVFLCDSEPTDSQKIIVIKMVLDRLQKEDCFMLRFHLPNTMYRFPVDKRAYSIIKQVTQYQCRWEDKEWREILTVLEFEMA